MAVSSPVVSWIRSEMRKNLRTHSLVQHLDLQEDRGQGTEKMRVRYQQAAAAAGRR
jgi:hypothetical protein